MDIPGNPINPSSTALVSPFEVMAASLSRRPDTTHFAKQDEPVLEEQEDQPTSADRLFHAVMGRFTAGISPASLALAYADWSLHLSQSPGKQQILVEKAMRKFVRLFIYVVRNLTEPECDPCIQPLIQDRRFRAEQWQHWPFCLIYQSFLLHQQWWHNATTGIGGMSQHHQQVVSFTARQLLDMLSPVNFIATNPEVLDATARENGQNLLRGMQYLIEDWERSVGGKPPVGSQQFRPGHEVAITPGQVIYRNRLIELIQYAPQTRDAFQQPVLIVPAWIMKYYILDLSPHNSLVNYLVQRGHTVYMISWRNPGPEERDMGMDDYLHRGLLDALHQVCSREPDQQVNAVGYCLGGTLLAIAAAWLSQQHQNKLASLTLLAAQTDFTEAGELRLFIDDSQLDYLDDIMWNQGFLDNRQMAGAFQLLRSRDLIWSRMVNQYLLGQRENLTDLMAWNADATRMPYRMQSEYLRQLFLNNDLFAGRFKVGGRPLALGDIRIPSFVVATEADHVAPWRSVYKLNLAIGADLTFLLTSGGHNAGITSEPGHPRRRYRVGLCPHGENYIDPDRWLQTTPLKEGSWWPAWAKWLEQGQKKRPSRPIDFSHAAGLPAAPGEYVLQK
jgi:polyhydroxyalkanoate synthase